MPDTATAASYYRSPTASDAATQAQRPIHVASADTAAAPTHLLICLRQPRPPAQQPSPPLLPPPAASTPPPAPRPRPTPPAAPSSHATRCPTAPPQPPVALRHRVPHRPLLAGQLPAPPAPPGHRHEGHARSSPPPPPPRTTAAPRRPQRYRGVPGPAGQAHALGAAAGPGPWQGAAPWGLAHHGAPLTPAARIRRLHGPPLVPRTCHRQRVPLQGSWRTQHRHPAAEEREQLACSRRVRCDRCCHPDTWQGPSKAPLVPLGCWFREKPPALPPVLLLLPLLLAPHLPPVRLLEVLPGASQLAHAPRHSPCQPYVLVAHTVDSCPRPGARLQP